MSEDVKGMNKKSFKKKLNLHSLVVSVTRVEAVREGNLQHDL